MTTPYVYPEKDYEQYFHIATNCLNDNEMTNAVLNLAKAFCIAQAQCMYLSDYAHQMAPWTARRNRCLEILRYLGEVSTIVAM